MELLRREILPGVNLNYIQSDKFKSSSLSISMLTQLTRETASQNAVIPYVLSRGSKNYPDIQALGNAMDDLYSADISPVIRLVGEIQCTGLICSFPEERFLPVGNEYLNDVINLISEILLNPVMKNGFLLQEYVDSEKLKMADNLRAAVNEKRTYALKRCIEEMCCYEEIAVGKAGSPEDCENIDYKELTSHYNELLSSSPVEIIFCGSAELKRVENALKAALKNMPRGEINYDIGTDIRLNTVEDSARYVEEAMDVTQGKLVLGFRLGDWMDNLNLAELSVFNAIYGAGITSKLFMNVREKLSLCYYASSSVNAHKGIMTVSSGIDFNKFEDAKSEIIAQLSAVSSGDISDDELTWAKMLVKSDLKTVSDSPGAIEAYYFTKIISGYDVSPEKYSDMVDAVKKDDVMNLAKSIVLDMVYFLRNDHASESESNNTSIGEDK